jgi:hypothetical protein
MTPQYRLRSAMFAKWEEELDHIQNIVSSTIGYGLVRLAFMCSVDPSQSGCGASQSVCVCVCVCVCGGGGGGENIKIQSEKCLTMGTVKKRWCTYTYVSTFFWLSYYCNCSSLASHSCHLFFLYSTPWKIVHLEASWWYNSKDLYNSLTLSDLQILHVLLDITIAQTTREDPGSIPCNFKWDS